MLPSAALRACFLASAVLIVSTFAQSCMYGAPRVGGACWFEAAPRKSCEDACEDLGLAYDPASESFAGSDAQCEGASCDGQCGDVLVALTENLSGAKRITSRSSVGSGDPLVSCLLMSTFGGSDNDGGAGCWRYEDSGSSVGYRCAIVDTTAEFKVPIDGLIAQRRACACQNKNVTHRAPPEGYTWTDIGRNVVASECYFNQNGVWHPSMPDACMCAKHKELYWDPFDLYSPLHGGTVCEELALDGSSSRVPQCRSTDCGSLSLGDCGACLLNEFGVVSADGVSCECSDGTPVPSGHGLRSYCVEALGLGAPTCAPPPSQCEICQEDRDSCQTDLTTCSSGYQGCIEDAAGCSTDPGVNEMCCPEHQFIIEELNNLIDSLTGAVASRYTAEPEWFTPQRVAMLSAMTNKIDKYADLLAIVQNPPSLRQDSF